MKDSKSVLLMVALIIFFVYILRGILGRITAFLLVPIDTMLYISNNISPVSMWMFLGLLAGLVYGSFIAIKKYKLDYKLLTYPIAVMVILLGFVVLASYIRK